MFWSAASQDDVQLDKNAAPRPPLQKLYETAGCTRGVVPPGFAYFGVSFALTSGFAHQIENESEWVADFGRGVLEGIVEAPEAGIPLARRKKQSFDELQKRVVDFSQAWAPHDWTASLKA